MIAMQVMRPRVVHTYAKKKNFTSPREAPGEGRRRAPNRKENEDSRKGVEPRRKEVHPIKKFLMDVFKIEEIDYEKFREENMWAIRPTKKK
jgi:hypothetical protein